VWRVQNCRYLIRDSGTACQYRTCVPKNQYRLSIISYRLDQLWCNISDLCFEAGFSDISFPQSKRRQEPLPSKPALPHNIPLSGISSSRKPNLTVVWLSLCIRKFLLWTSDRRGDLLSWMRIFRPWGWRQLCAHSCIVRLTVRSRFKLLRAQSRVFYYSCTPLRK
jgi:hypothetical protein